MKLKQSIETEKVEEKSLFLTHITKSAMGLNILENGRISVSNCKVMKEDLLYFFYGRAEYRDGADFVNNLNSRKPICFIVDSSKCHEVYKVFPFDTGAFDRCNGIRSNYFDHISDINDLMIGNDIESAQKLVKTFYQTNKNYWSFKAIPKKFNEFTEMDACNYTKLISSQPTGNLDGRASSVEIITKYEIPCEDVVAIIAPYDFFDQDGFNELINEFNITPIFYRCSSPSKIAEFSSLIRDKFEEFQEKNV